jgi:hypothetical protein
MSPNVAMCRRSVGQILGQHLLPRALFSLLCPYQRRTTNGGIGTLSYCADCRMQAMLEIMEGTLERPHGRGTGPIRIRVLMTPIPTTH